MNGFEELIDDIRGNDVLGGSSHDERRLALVRDYMASANDRIQADRCFTGLPILSSSD